MMSNWRGSMFEDSGFWTETLEPMDDPIYLSVVTDPNEFSALADDWNKIAEQAGATIFQTFEWNYTWWQHFGEGNRLYLMTFYQSNRLVGVAPMFLDSVSVLGFDGFTALRFIGSNVSQPAGKPLIGLISYSDYLDFIIRPGYEDALFALFVNHLATQVLPAHEVILDVLPETSLVWSKLMPLLNKESWKVQTFDCVPSQLISLKDGWESYLSSLSKNRRYQTRLSLKRSRKKDYKVFDVCKSQTKQELLDDFDRLAEMHQQKWNLLGSLGSFYEQRNYNFHRDVMLALYCAGWVELLKAIPVDDKSTSVAMDLLYRFNNRLFAVHGVADPESEYYKDGPGMVLLAHTLKQAANDEIEIFDFLRGDEEYKSGYSNVRLSSRAVTIAGLQPWWRKAIAGILKSSMVMQKKIYREWLTVRMIISHRTIWKGLIDYFQSVKERFMAIYSKEK